MGRSKSTAKFPPWKSRITRHLIFFFLIYTNYLPSNSFPCKWTVVWHWGGCCLLQHCAVMRLVTWGYLPAWIIQSDFEFWYHSYYADVTQITSRWGVYWYQESLNARVKKPPVSYLQNSQCSGTFLLRSQFLYFFLYRVYLAASIFVIRAMATGNLSGALRKVSVMVVEGFLSLRTVTQFLPSSPPNWTELNQAKPVLWFSKLTILWKT